MAETYKPFGAALTTTYATVYECPTTDPPTTAIVLSAIAANVDGTVSAGVSAQWLDSSNSDTAKRIIDGVVVPATASVNLLSGPVVLEAGDAFQAKASASGDIELTLVVNEIT
jgi:hypothetical protein